MAKPNRAALHAHLDQIDSLKSKRAALGEKARAASLEADAANKATAEFSRLQVELETLEGDARYTGVEIPNHKDLQNALAKAELKSKGLASHGRAALNAHRRFAADMGDCNRQIEALTKLVPPLLHAALLEAVGDTAEEFKAAEAAFRAVHRKAFIAARAADQVAAAHGLRQYGAMDLYRALTITRPNHDVYRTRVDPLTPGLTPEEAMAAGHALAQEHEAVAQDLRELEKEAERFANSMDSKAG